VEIRPEGWRIVARPSLRFLRGGALEALPIPTPSKGDANLLRGFLNVETEDDFRGGSVCLNRLRAFLSGFLPRLCRRRFGYRLLEVGLIGRFAVKR
jgi:hypothetical protein